MGFASKIAASRWMSSAAVQSKVGNHGDLEVALEVVAIPRLFPHAH